jgi:hypothetical protein
MDLERYVARAEILFSSVRGGELARVVEGV